MAKNNHTPIPTQTVGVDEDGFEILGGDSSPMGVGEVVQGPFKGVARFIKPKRKGAAPVPIYQIGARTVMGSAVLKERIESGKVQEGDYLKVTRLEDGTAKAGQNAPKMYDVRVKRATAPAA